MFVQSKFIVSFPAALLILFAAPSGAQTVLPVPQAAEELIKNVPQPTRDEYYAKLRAALRKNTPRIVFVPGVLGSKIDECRTDGSQCTTIWGTRDTLISVKSDGLSMRSDRTYRTDVVESVLFKDIYGDVLDHIRASAAGLISDDRNDPPLTVFHYDWRKSNWDNATGLAKAICAVRAAAPDSPIVIVAHSMGGLMTKVWLKEHSGATCPNGTKPSIGRVVFVATPHLGSPKTIKAILQGYNYLFEETNILSRPLGRFATNYLMNAFNQAGPSFPSIYELLPIRSSEYCTVTKKALSSASVPVATNDGKPINIFDPEIWQRHDFLNRIGGSADSRKVYYTQRVAPLLKQSEQLLCDLADYDPSKATEIMYVVGREKGANTIGWSSLKLGAAEIFEKSTNVEGDGTVPSYSAQNTLISSNSEPLVIDANHLSIISHRLLLEKIDRWYSDASVSARKEIASLGNSEFDTIMVAEAAASGNLFPVSINARDWANADNQLAIKINARALATMGYTSSDVADVASWSDTTDRARLYAISASTTDSARDKAAWLTDVAKWAYVSSEYDAAIANSELILGTKADSKKAIPNFVEFEKEATKLAGWSYLRRGNREKFNMLASEFNQKFSTVEFSDPAIAAIQLDDRRYMKITGQGKTVRGMDFFFTDDVYQTDKRTSVPNAWPGYRQN